MNITEEQIEKDFQTSQEFSRHFAEAAQRFAKEKGVPNFRAFIWGSLMVIIDAAMKTDAEYVSKSPMYMMPSMLLAKHMMEFWAIEMKKQGVNNDKADPNG